MKKLLFIVFALLVCLDDYATQPLKSEVYEKDIRNNEIPILVTIELQEEVLSILSNGVLENACITITDSFGNIRHTEQATIVMDTPFLILVSELESDIYNIDIDVDGYYFNGSFIIQ